MAGITMTELAKRLCLSQSTVSRALNGKDKGRMKSGLAARIREEAEKMGYQPNPAAATLRTGVSKMIGVSLPSPRNLRNAELAAALHHEIVAQGYLPFFAFHENREEQKRKIPSLLSLNLAGLITIEPNALPDLPDLPIVGYYYQDERFDLLQLDMRDMIHQILAYLQKLGHRKIAVIGLDGDVRYPVFFESLADYGMICPDSCRILFSGFFPPGGDLFDCLLRQTEGEPPPTAILVHNDPLALAVMRRIRECGYSVPADFSVVGNEDIALARESVPSLTSVRYETPEILAQKMVAMLLERRAHPERPLQRILIKPELVIRESCTVL